MDEAEIVRQVQSGDLDMFGRLMDLHVRRLRAFISLKAPVGWLIDEIAHETFIYAFQHIREFEAGTAFFPWLKAIAVNIFRAEIQRYSREQANLMKYSEQLAIEEAAQSAGQGDPTYLEHLERCLQGMPPESRKLLNLKYKLQHSAEEIARLVHQSVPWVRTTLFRLREQIRRCMERRIAAEKA